MSVVEMSLKYAFNFQAGTPILNDPRWSWERTSETQSVADVNRPSCRISDSTSDDSQPPQGGQLRPEVAGVRPATEANVVADDSRLADGERRESDVAISSPVAAEEVENLPAESTSAVANVQTTTSSTASRKRPRAKTMTDFYRVKKSRSMTAPVTSKDGGSTSSDSS